MWRACCRFTPSLRTSVLTTMSNRAAARAGGASVVRGANPHNTSSLLPSLPLMALSAALDSPRPEAATGPCPAAAPENVTVLVQAAVPGPGRTRRVGDPASCSTVTPHSQILDWSTAWTDRNRQPLGSRWLERQAVCGYQQVLEAERATRQDPAPLGH